MKALFNQWIDFWGKAQVGWEVQRRYQPSLGFGRSELSRNNFWCPQACFPRDLSLLRAEAILKRVCKTENINYQPFFTYNCDII